MSSVPQVTNDYHEPFLWWGPVWAPPPPRTMVDLLRERVITPAVAAMLWAALTRRRSIVVAAGPRGVGKTTLLTALLDFLPPGTRRLYLRGCYESFAFLDDATVFPSDSVLLVNEISPHLPAYLWGPGVRRLFQAARNGFMFAATAHASTVGDLVGQLAGYPLRVPLSELATINLALFLAEGREARHDPWHVGEVWETAIDRRQGLSVSLLAHNGEPTEVATSDLPAGPQRVTSAAEIASRTAFLTDLSASNQELSRQQLRQVLARYSG